MDGGAMGVGQMASDLIMYQMNEDQQKRLQQSQAQQNRRLQAYNQELAVKSWNETNAEAQVAHLKNAGLSTGLMYKSGGPGGQTTSQPASVSMGVGSQPMDVGRAAQTAMAVEMQKAQIENIKADTNLKNETAGKPTAETANIQAETAKKGEETKNVKLQGELMDIERKIKTATQEDLIKQAAAVSDKAVGEAISSRAKGEIDEATYNDKIKQIKQDTAEQQLRMAAQKIGLTVSQQQINKMATEINMMQQSNMREWDKMSQTDREIQIKKLLSNSQIDLMDAQQIKAWTSIITDMVNATPTPGPRPIGF